MESARTYLFIALVFLSFLLYQEWDKAHDKSAPATPIEKTVVSDSVSDDQIAASQPPTEQQALSDNIASQVPAELNETETLPADKNLKPVEVITDTLRVLISPRGGNIISTELLNYKQEQQDNSPPMKILQNSNGRTFVALSGLYGKDAPDMDGEKVYYQTEKNNYQLSENQQTISVKMSWTNQQGVEYQKSFTFHKGKYFIDLQYLVINHSNNKIANRLFTAVKRDRLPVANQESSGFVMQSFLGPAYSTSEERYEKVSFDDLDDDSLLEQTRDGWVAILQHYFVTAWVPKSDTTHQIDATTKTSDLGRAGLAQIRITQDWQYIEPDQSKTFDATLYVGPKIQKNLRKVGEHLDLTVDYSFLWWIGQPLFYLLAFFQSFVGNWGVAIILVTLVIKALLYPLARAQYRSFAKMRLLAPKMAAMKEQYGSDRQQMSMKMMELYRKEKVNPLGGCFPLLIQMPVFIALYWVLMESVELRHAPFMLWIEDLSVQDPYFILPFLMGASMYLMQKMQPMSPTMDPMQQKIFQLMPVFMTLFFFFFPAGLVLYWLMNNLISIAQQVYITKQFEKEIANKKTARKK